ncbi:UNVERIFIED_CONTAM: acetate CoA/acetoacetate CoA-transferase alpha subunit [Brevibacillus sp. OAP136]
MNPLFSKMVSLSEALETITDGTSLMYGGFGGIGSPADLIAEIMNKGVRDLALIGNDAGFPDAGIGRLITNGQVKSLITSHIGSNPVAGQQMMDGTLAIEFFPQGILAEKIRAGGVGLPGIIVDVGMGTIVEDGKQKVKLNGGTYLVEPALTADVGIVYAKRADTYGNLIFDKTARNLNPLVAMACEVTIVEVEELVPVGELDPEMIVTPGIYVDYIVQRNGGETR